MRRLLEETLRTRPGPALVEMVVQLADEQMCVSLTDIVYPTMLIVCYDIAPTAVVADREECNASTGRYQATLGDSDGMVEGRSN